MKSVRGNAGRYGARLTFGLIVVAVNAAPGRAEGPEARELRRGLVASFTGLARGQQIMSLEPTVALALKDNEAPHPRLACDEFAAEWAGQINVRPDGTYRFTVRLRGDFRLKVAGREVLKARCGDKEPRLIEGSEVQLTAGAPPLVAPPTQKPGGAAAGRLLWARAGRLPQGVPVSRVVPPH